MRIRVTAAAKRDLYQAHAYYEAKSTGLGDAFLDDVAASFALIRDYPQGWISLSDNYRRRYLSKFRYGVVYRIDEDGDVATAVIIGIGHLSRRPEYWRKMLERKDV